MRRRGERVALVLAALALGVAGGALALEVLGHASTLAAVGFATIGFAAGGACVTAWARGPRGDPRRLPLLLAGAVFPADAAFALASVLRDRAGSTALVGAGAAAVAVAVALLFRQQR